MLLAVLTVDILVVASNLRNQRIGAAVMVKRYDLSDEAWTVVAELFNDTHGRGRPRLMFYGVRKCLTADSIVDRTHNCTAS